MEKFEKILWKMNEVYCKITYDIPTKIYEKRNEKKGEK